CRPGPGTRHGAGRGRRDGRPRTLAAAERPMAGMNRRAVLLIAGLHFAMPMVCALIFSIGLGTPGQGVSFDAYTGIAGAEGLAASMALTVKLALATIAVVLTV